MAHYRSYHSVVLVLVRFSFRHNEEGNFTFSFNVAIKMKTGILEIFTIAKGTDFGSLLTYF